MAVLMMPMSVCLMDLPHTKAAVDEQAAGAKTGLRLSATSSQTGTLSSGKARRLLSEKHGRASTSGRQWRARVVDVVGGYLLGDVMVEANVSEREKQKQPRASLLIHALAPVILPAWLIAGQERLVPTNVTRALTPVLAWGEGGWKVDRRRYY
jgi:hypothetical protein